MSSDEGANTYLPPRRLSSTSESPRKRRRLGSSLDPAQLRRHDVLRKQDVEAKYSDAYRLLFNEHVTQAAARFDVETSVQHYSKQIGSALWSSTEQAVFFAALERLTKNDVAGIARAIGTKTEAETSDFLVLLQDAAANQGNADLTLRDIPAAVQVGHECSQQLDRAGESLAWYQERLEAFQEQERYGDYWLITPSIADEVEAAIHGIRPSRPASEAHEVDFNRIGPGVAGACAFCKKRKKKCNRETPCNNCAKSGVDCVYPKSPYNAAKTSPAPGSTPNDREGEPATVDKTTENQILQAIPQATLLNPDMMLTLSKHLFMNRSDSFPSPWPHWSHYTSELATEPSLYRTAFNDFHSLVVSLTKRLVQTSLMQTTSRLRAQRSRNKKGRLPMVRPRDVYTAIDALGMKRNGGERWRGVPRRCGLRVITSKLTPQGKHAKEMREVPWDEVERAMSPTAGTEVETSTEPEGFKSRAARSGTPLPMQNLTISDSDDDHIAEHTEVTDDDDSDYSEPLDGEEVGPSVRHAPQSENTTDRDDSIASRSVTEEPLSKLNTIEDFDWEASRIEERALWKTLDMQPAITNHSRKFDGELEDVDNKTLEKITTAADDWRQYQEYRAPWETHETPVSVAELLANQKPPSPMPVSYGSRLCSTRSASSDSSAPSSTTRSRRKQLKSKTEVELHARGTNAYAALRRENLTDTDIDSEASASDTTSASLEEDTIAQSIEREGDTLGIDGVEDEMEWT